MKNDNVHDFDASMRTDQPHHPQKAYAWGAAQQINMLVDADDADLWDTFFAFLRRRKCFDELAERLKLAGE